MSDNHYSLAVLMVSSRNREKLRDRAVHEIQKQIRAANLSYGVISRTVKPVRFIYKILTKDISKGLVRNELINTCNSDYVCHIDDDDIIPVYYIEEILRAIKSKPDVVGLRCEVISMVTDMKRQFVLSKQYKECFSLPSRNHIDGVYYRNVSHLNPIRRELAIKAGFTKDNHEDNRYSDALVPILNDKTEVFIDRIMYYYFHRCKLE